jgi:hypothetical protein
MKFTTISNKIDYYAWGFYDHKDTYGVRLHHINADFLWCHIAKGAKFCCLISRSLIN